MKPTGATNGYIVSDGYGGAHMLLWGFTGTPGNITGNMNMSGGVVSFGGNYLVAQGEWCHHAVGIGSLVGQQCWTYVNGVPDGVVSLPGTRQTGGPVGNLYIGGSDHINLAMDCAFVRGWDFGSNPFINAPYIPFAPPRHLSYADSLGEKPSFVMPFNVPGQLTDLAPLGTVIGGNYVQHHGSLGDSTPGGAIGDYAFGSFQGPNFPYWIADANSPFMRPIGVGSFATGESIPAPLTPPGGCLVFDSFGRRNQTHFTDLVPTLGSTEAGSLGVLAWNTGFVGTPSNALKTWGILQGQACPLGLTLSSAWVETGSATQDVRVKGPTVGAYCTGHTGLTFRQVDKDNFIGAFYQPSSWTNYAGGGSMYVFQVVGGSVGSATGYAVASGDIGWIRATASGTTLTFYASPDGATWTQIGQQTGVTQFQAATKAGITCGTSATNPMGLTRVDQFACY